MVPVLQGQSFASAAEFVAALNKARLSVGTVWMTYVGDVAGKAVRLKSYGTGYLQICEVDGLKHGAPMDMKVTAWREFIVKAIDYQGSK